MEGSVIIILWIIRVFWNWFWYYRHGKAIVRIWKNNDGTYEAVASNGIATVCKCYGSTFEAAKEMAIFRLTELLKDKVPLDD